MQVDDRSSGHTDLGTSVPLPSHRHHTAITPPSHRFATGLIPLPHRFATDMTPTIGCPIMYYQFRREINGKVIEVDFATMMTMDVAGFITLEDGAQAKRLSQGGIRIKGEVLKGKPDGVHVSDSLGFCEHQFEYFEHDRIKHGFTELSLFAIRWCRSYSR